MNKLGGCKQKKLQFYINFIVVMYASFYIYQILNILSEIDARIASSLATLWLTFNFWLININALQISVNNKDTN